MLRSRISGEPTRTAGCATVMPRGCSAGCGRKSVFTQVIEQDFARLIRLLTIDEETLPVLVDLAAGAEEGGWPTRTSKRRRRRPSPRRGGGWRTRAFLFLEGDISQEEYLRRKGAQRAADSPLGSARTTESEKATIELAMCMNAGPAGGAVGHGGG